MYKIGFPTNNSPYSKMIWDGTCSCSGTCNTVVVAVAVLERRLVEMLVQVLQILVRVAVVVQVMVVAVIFQPQVVLD